MIIIDATREKKFNFPLAEQKFIIINDEYLLQYWSIEYHNRYWHQWFRVKNLFNTLTFFLEKIENNDQFLFFLLFALDHHYHHQHNNNNDDAWCNFNDMFFFGNHIWCWWIRWWLLPISWLMFDTMVHRLKKFEVIHLHVFSSMKKTRDGLRVVRCHFDRYYFYYL